MAHGRQSTAGPPRAPLRRPGSRRVLPNRTVAHIVSSEVHRKSRRSRAPSADASALDSGAPPELVGLSGTVLFGKNVTLFRRVDGKRVPVKPTAEMLPKVSGAVDAVLYLGKYGNTADRWRPEMKVILAGDYMSIPCTEGAAESGHWAATALVGRSGRVGRDFVLESGPASPVNLS